ncbi:MAG: flagellar hook-basal body protein [Aquificota bacterium]|mgnify:CR=1 FL=1|nr:flagellar hook-basal body protein [Aquificaceae bacterium]MDM7267301.1 flagellar hook-basal body protein [Aquificaceae bacterium]QWK12847.1 MAG: flagellar hook-basal body protein [Aquificota bacterium]
MAIEYQPLYILSSGMLLQQRKLETITNNLANVDTPAFKKDLMFASLWETPMGQRVMDTDPQNPNNNFLYPIIERVFTDLSQGSIRQTSNPLDLAIEGEGFFAVRRGQEVFYTRKGNFRLDNDGFLVNELGYRVLDQNLNEIRLEGVPTFGRDGSVFVNNVQVATLGIFRLENPQKVGRDLFLGQPQPAQNFRVLQGYLEMSNVNPILEMANLIQTHRAHETYSNLIRSLDSLYERFNQSF